MGRGDTAVEKFKYRGYKVRIEQDLDASNPYKEWDQLSDVTFWWRGYDLDSTGKGQLHFKEPTDVLNAYGAGDIVYFQWIHGYIHSGITISLDKSQYPFNDVWDSGLAGVVYVTKEKARENWPHYRGRTLWLACERAAKGEVKTLDQYLTGQVYGYVITHRGTDADSCWGFYGLEYCIEEAKCVVDSDIATQLEGHEKVLDGWLGFIPEEVFYGTATSATATTV